MFGLPILLLSPLAGRLVDRRGSLGVHRPRVDPAGDHRPPLYPPVDPTLAVPLILIESTGFAMLNPALYAVVAANSPPGRSSTAQGLFGAAGTVGFIVASLVAGALAAENILYPLYVFSGVMTATLVLGLLIGGSRLRAKGSPAARSADPFDRIGPERVPYAGGVEQRQLVGLITRRSSVRIRPPQPMPSPEPRVRPPGVPLCPGTPSGPAGSARIGIQSRPRSLRIRFAASLPGAPMTQPPGCVPEPHW